ncbi:MAG TPA: ABC transporter substrate-binding protein [Ilumatobacter sp.]|nr:ABC transporter substrate-binding protein [Ilumatobacter sp.]
MAVAALALAGTACGSDDDSSATPTAPAPTAAPATTQADDDVDDTDDGANTPDTTTAGSDPGDAVSADLGSVKLGLAVAGAFDFMPAYAAESGGFWADRGLSVEIVTFAGDARLQQAIAAGEIDFGLGGAAAALPAIEAGQEAKLVASIANSLELFGLFVRDDITSVDQLAGTSIGVTGPNAITDTLIKLVSRDLTGDLDNGISRQPLGLFDAQIAAFETGQIDGFVWTIEGLLQAEAQGLGHTLLTFDEVVPDFVAKAVMATDQMINDRPDAVAALLAGLYEGARVIESDEAAAVALFTDVTGVSDVVAAQVWAEARSSLSLDGVFDEAAFDTLVGALVDVEVLSSTEAAEAAIDSQFLPIG